MKIFYSCQLVKQEIAGWDTVQNARFSENSVLKNREFLNQNLSKGYSTTFKSKISFPA